MLNKAILIGNVGNDPEVRTMQSGDEVASFSLATSERWKNKDGEKKESTEWHKIVIFNKGLVGLCKQGHIRKGAQLYIEGQIKTRCWDQDGQKKYMTEIVLRPYAGEIKIVKFAGDSNPGTYQEDGPGQSENVDELEDEIPF